MESSRRTSQSTDDKLLLLREEQEQYGEGTAHWAYLQQQINQIVAQNFLNYLNR